MSELAQARAHVSEASTGLLPAQQIQALINSGEIAAEAPLAPEQIQPASLDLRLGPRAYRVRASFLPGPGVTVAEKIARLSTHEVDLSSGAVLERDCVYLVPLLERVRLSERIAGVANPKSSIGRIDLFTRLVTDGAAEFDRIRPGYAGPLYVELSPRAFSVLVRQGSRLNQLRFSRGDPRISASELRRLHAETPLVDRALPAGNWEGIPLSVDLSGDKATRFIGYKARKHTGLIDVDVRAAYDPGDFWEPIEARGNAGIILNPGDFYILASKEAVTVPPTYAAELAAYDPLFGEFRVHYAGFFDPGFGHAEAGGSGTRAVLEVRSHNVPFLIEDGQMVGRLVYERLAGRPDRLYGARIGSSYQRQGLQLSRHFKPFGA
ncbi:MAG TPA: 2'-deoxycytidine 5'-triphosphate deaminase [Alphaproteobacteria bacterium]